MTELDLIEDQIKAIIAGSDYVHPRVASRARTILAALARVRSNHLAALAEIRNLKESARTAIDAGEVMIATLRSEKAALTTELNEVQKIAGIKDWALATVGLQLQDRVAHLEWVLGEMRCATCSSRVKAYLPDSVCRGCKDARAALSSPQSAPGAPGQPSSPSTSDELRGHPVAVSDACSLGETDAAKDERRAALLEEREKCVGGGQIGRMKTRIIDDQLKRLDATTEPPEPALKDWPEPSAEEMFAACLRNRWCVVICSDVGRWVVQEHDSTIGFIASGETPNDAICAAMKTSVATETASKQGASLVPNPEGITDGT